MTAHHAIIRIVFVWVCVCLCACWGGWRGGVLLIPCCEVPLCKTPAVFNAQEEKVFPEYEADLKNQCSSLIGF